MGLETLSQSMSPADITVLPSTPGSVLCGCGIAVNTHFTKNYCGSSIYSCSAPSRHDNKRFEVGRNLQNGFNSCSTSGVKSDSGGFNSSISFINLHDSHSAETHTLNLDKELITRSKVTGPVVYYDAPSARKNKGLILIYPKLVVSHQPDEISQEGSIVFFRLMFMKLDPQVKVYPRSKTNKYILKFQDTKLAQEAFIMGREMGLKIER